MEKSWEKKSRSDQLLHLLGGTLAEGYIVIPNLIYAGLIRGRYGQITYLLPFVLLYAFEKAGVFLVSGFGRVRNSTALIRIGLGLAVLGAALTLGGVLGNSLVLPDIGAACVGLGLSCYNALFRAAEFRKRQSGAKAGTAVTMMGHALTGILIVLIFLLRGSLLPAIIACFLTLLLAVLLLMCFRSISERERMPLFEGQKRPIFFLYAAIAVLLTLCVRGYKQTAGAFFLMPAAALMILLFTVIRLSRQKRFYTFSVRAAWYGAVRNFVIIFSLIGFTATGQPELVTVAYFMVGLGVCLSKLCEKPVRKLCETLNRKTARYSRNGLYQAVCISLCCIGLILMIPMQTVLYMAGVLLIVTFAAAGNAAGTRSFTELPFSTPEEKYLIRARFYGMGTMIQQGFLMLTLSLFSPSGENTPAAALQDYTLSQGSMANEAVFRATLAISASTLVLCGMAAIFYRGRKPAQ